MPWQFSVVDGADAGRIFGLPDTGIATIGSSRKHADIDLNDLYVMRIHAEVSIDGPKVVLTAHDSPGGTMVNGQKITQDQVLKHGDVIRMGNSHLRLEDVDIAATEAPPEEEDVPAYEVEVLPEDDAVPEDALTVTPADEAPLEVVEAVGEPAPSGAAAAPAVTATKAQPLPGERLRELVGHALAHFQVEEVIAEGHSSMVFQALDQKKDAYVALKVLGAEFPYNDAEMQRFVQVYKTVLPLRHPHLVSYYGIGKTGPFCWLSMELVEHTPVPEIIEKLQDAPKIDWQRPFRVALQIGQALAFAHQHKAVHRNITAAHILWRRADKTCKLSDLGLAAAILDTNLSQVALRNKLQAELEYLSPEQTQPGCFVDGVCDIYSLGVVVYALLTGRYPCTGTSQAEIIRNIRETPPVRPTKLQPEIPKRLEAVVLKMLAKRQEDRYQTAEQLLADLQAVSKEEGIS
jgi:hypothetical protein